MSLFSFTRSILLSIALCAQLFFPAFVLAQASAQRSSGSSGGSSRGASSVQAGLRATASTGRLDDYCNGQSFRHCVEQVVGGAVSLVLSLSGIVLLGYLLYAGFLWMTSGGESDKAQEAMQMIRNAVIGLVILASAFAISSFVLRSLDTAFSPAAPEVETSSPDSGGGGSS